MPAINKLLNESTTVVAETSLAEITKELVKAGARQVSTQYRDGRVHGLSWSMALPNGAEAWFTMPARAEAVYRILAGRQRGYVSEARRQEMREKANRIAWRHLYRWVQAQVAMIQTGMLAPAEPFTAFATVPGSDQTLFQAFMEARALPAPAGEAQ